MGTLLIAAVLGAASLTLSAVFMPVVRRLADRYRWYDPPDHRKLHTGNITNLGGVGIFLAFCIVVVGAGAVLDLYSTRLAFLLLGAFTLNVIGLVDDLRNLRALPRLIAHLLIAGIVASGGFVMTAVSVPGLGRLELGWAAYPLTILWIAGVVNAMNWADGMDGYAGGIAAFAVAAMGVSGAATGSTLTVILCFSLFGALLGFLLSNFPPARIFMGDNGATFLGFILAVLPFAEESEPGAATRVTAMGLLLLLPLLDFVTSIIRRVAGGKSPGSPDRGHVHHRLQDLGLKPRQVLAVVYPICAFLALIALAVANPPPWMPQGVVLAAFVTTMALTLALAVFLSAPPRARAGDGSLPRDRTARRAG